MGPVLTSTAMAFAAAVVVVAFVAVSLLASPVTRLETGLVAVDGVVVLASASRLSWLGVLGRIFGFYQFIIVVVNSQFVT